MSKLQVSTATLVMQTLLLILAAMTAPLQAQSGFCLNPTTWPESVTASYQGSQVALTLGPPTSGGIVQVQITVVGNLVTIDGSSASGCEFGIPRPPTTQTFLVGLLMPGSYVLRVVHRGFFGGPFTVERLFLVAGAGASAPVPALPALGVALLALVVGAAGVIMMRARNQ